MFVAVASVAAAVAAEPVQGRRHVATDLVEWSKIFGDAGCVPRIVAGVR